MFGNYLGLGGDKRGGVPDPKAKKYGRAQEKASPSTRCGKCNGLGHFTYECKGQREYKVRPTRTQILNNPKLQTKLTASLPPQMEIPTEGTAAAILAANESKRAAKIKAAAVAAAQSSSSSSSSSSGSSSSGSSSSGSGSDSGSESDSGDERRRSRRRRSRSRSRSRTPERERRSRSPDEERRDRNDEGRERRGEESSRSKGKGRAVDRDDD